MSSEMTSEMMNKDDEKPLNDEKKKSVEKELPELPPVQKNEANAIPAFDFHEFLEQFKNAQAISRSTKDFISSFYSNNTNTLDQQIKSIHDFLHEAYIRMREDNEWKNMSEDEFENAKEGMEKLLMNRLYPITFSSSLTDDKEKDDILQRKISIFSWIKERHLDIPETEDNDSFISFAASELLKMNHFKAPRDKLICILNCCKIIFGLMKHISCGESADTFFPLFIYVIIRANPAHLISNVQYILRFRDPDHLTAEASYYLTNMMGAISFIKTMDVHSLSITQEEFDRNIEQRMKELDREHHPHINKQPEEEDEEEHYPFYKRLLRNREPYLKDMGQEAIQKSVGFVRGFFSKGDGEEDEIEERPLPPRPNNDHQRDEKAPPLPPRSTPIDFNQHLKTLESMFPNVEPYVCFMFLQASNGNITQAIDSLLETSND